MYYSLVSIINSNYNEATLNMPLILGRGFRAGVTVSKYGIMLLVKNRVLHLKVFSCIIF